MALNSEKQGERHSLAALDRRGCRKKPEATREQRANGQGGGKKPRGRSCPSKPRADLQGPKMPTRVDLPCEDSGHR